MSDALSGHYTFPVTCPSCMRSTRFGLGAVLDYGELDDKSWVTVFGDALSKRGYKMRYANWERPVTRHVSFGCRCAECGTPSVLVLAFPDTLADSVRDHIVNRRQSSHRTDFNDGDGALYLGQLPAPETPTSSRHVPADAGELYVEAVLDLRAKRKPAGVIAKCRSILDVCLTDRGFGNGSRRQRIAAMRDAKMLTEDLADWAENLWDDGNPAVHKIKGDEDKARQHVDFLRLFFEVVYDIPAQVISSRAGNTGSP